MQYSIYLNLTWTTKFKILLLLTILFSGCNEQINIVKNIKEKYSIRDAFVKRPLLEKSVLATNYLLEDSVNIKFQLIESWKIEKETSAESNSKLIPVFLLRKEGFLNNETIFVPADENCIFIIERNFDDFILNLSKSKNWSFEVDTINLLSLMLLHEVGHIANGHQGSFGDNQFIDLSSLNNYETINKNKELAADYFAAKIIKNASKTGFTKKESIAFSLRLFLGSLTFDLEQKDRLENLFANEQNRYWDEGYSHPNFRLRLKIINHFLLDTEESKAELEFFLNKRENPKTIWEKIREAGE